MVALSRGAWKMRAAAGIAAFLAVAAVAGAALPSYADTQPSPNVGASYQSPDDVYNWVDVPENRPVELTGVVFNDDGYVLFDKAGETINFLIIKDNLYAVQFAATPGKAMYVLKS